MACLALLLLKRALRAYASEHPISSVPPLTLSDYVCIENRPFKYLLQYTTHHFFYLHNFDIYYSQKHIFYTVSVIYSTTRSFVWQKKYRQSDFTLHDKVYMFITPLTVKPVPPFGGRFAIYFFEHCTKTTHASISYKR